MVRHRYAGVKMREVFPSPISPPNWGDPTTPSPALYQADKSLRDALGPPPSSRSFSSGRQALRGQRCVVNWAHADHSEPQDPKPVVSREELGPVFTLVVAERIDLGRHLIV